MPNVRAMFTRMGMQQHGAWVHMPLIQEAIKWKKSTLQQF